MIGPGAAKHQKTADSGWDHGTHVTGIAAGRKADLAGVAKDADIIAVNVYSKFVNSDYCYGSSCVLSFKTDQIAGMEYVYSLRDTYKIASVNMSLGGGKYDNQKKCNQDESAMKAAIDNLRAAGIATAVASGNGGYCDGIDSPACISSCMAVGSTDKTDQEAWSSNWHKSLLDIFAPGVMIDSSTGNSRTSYASWSGTSMATPHVAGTIALVKQAKPAATVNEVFKALRDKGHNGVVMRCQSGSKRRVQVDAAIQSLTATVLDSDGE